MKNIFRLSEKATEVFLSLGGAASSPGINTGRVNSDRNLLRQGVKWSDQQRGSSGGAGLLLPSDKMTAEQGGVRHTRIISGSLETKQGHKKRLTFFNVQYLQRFVSIHHQCVYF